MIISKTPLRISFVGGGTDLPDFYERYGGAVVSTAIDKWIHVIVRRRFEGDLRVGYSRTEIVDSVGDLQHELVREALRMTGLPRGLDVLTLADVPSRGTGLGSSSAVCVGLLLALYGFQGIYKSAFDLAEEASEIEITTLGKPIGRQDQYASAVGGFNLIEFMRDGGGVRVEPIITPPGTLERLHRQLMLFYTARTRAASDVLSGQRDAINAGIAIDALQEMRDLAYRFRDALGRGDADALAAVLGRNWELKRTVASGVSDSQIDGWYDRALEAGAVAGKLLGAGAGGFLLFVVPPGTPGCGPYCAERSARSALSLRYSWRAGGIPRHGRNRLMEEKISSYLSAAERRPRAHATGADQPLGESLLRAYRNNKQVFTLGNGGSASTASHMAADLAKNTIGPHMRRFRITSLNENAAIMTALANDIGYEYVFSEQLIEVIRPGDLLIAVSASGNSPNVLEAIRHARRQSAEVVRRARLRRRSGGQARRHPGDRPVRQLRDRRGRAPDDQPYARRVLQGHLEAARVGSV